MRAALLLTSVLGASSLSPAAVRSSDCVFGCDDIFGLIAGYLDVASLACLSLASRRLTESARAALDRVFVGADGEPAWDRMIASVQDARLRARPGLLAYLRPRMTAARPGPAGAFLARALHIVQSPWRCRPDLVEQRLPYVPGLGQLYAGMLQLGLLKASEVPHAAYLRESLATLRAMQAPPPPVELLKALHVSGRTECFARLAAYWPAEAFGTRSQIPVRLGSQSLEAEVFLAVTLCQPDDLPVLLALVQQLYRGFCAGQAVARGLLYTDLPTAAIVDLLGPLSATEFCATHARRARELLLCHPGHGLAPADVAALQAESFAGPLTRALIPRVGKRTLLATALASDADVGDAWNLLWTPEDPDALRLAICFGRDPQLAACVMRQCSLTQLLDALADLPRIPAPYLQALLSLPACPGLVPHHAAPIPQGFLRFLDHQLCTHRPFPISLDARTALVAAAVGMLSVKQLEHLALPDPYAEPAVALAFYGAVYGRLAEEGVPGVLNRRMGPDHRKQVFLLLFLQSQRLGTLLMWVQLACAQVEEPGNHLAAAILRAAVAQHGLEPVVARALQDREINVLAALEHFLHPRSRRRQNDQQNRDDSTTRLAPRPCRRGHRPDCGRPKCRR